MTLLPINLPKNVEILVSKGQKVVVGQTLATTKSFLSNIIHLSDFGITPQNLKSSLKKNLGDRLQTGDTLASKKKLFGSQKILSEQEGTISKIDEQTCDIYVKTEVGEAKPLISPVEGLIEICNNEQIVIKTIKNAISVSEAFGKDAIGNLECLKSVFLTEAIEGKIIAIEKLTKVLFYKALGLSAIGIITTKLDDLEFEELDEKNIDAALCLVGSKEFRQLEKINGKKILVDVKGKAIIVL
ncbi:MAG: hypothetical protein HYT06_01390 [Candidatus Levybacteria bacterium]|nr:hypothetical protein [Candidatus Levybacteria bacterium]